MTAKTVANLVTYTVAGMRVIFPSEKMTEKHPDRFATIHGEFYNEKGDKLSIKQKEVTNEDILNGASIDAENGLLTLPVGKRGRKASVGATQTEIEKRIANLRK